jgi:hypothetical protein
MVYFSERQIYIGIGDPLALPQHQIGDGKIGNYTITGQLDTEDVWQPSPLASNDIDIPSGRANLLSQRLGTNVSGNDHSVWWALVNEYTARDLTNPKDKLPAISGLAMLLYNRTFREDRTSRYIAGLWTNALESGLLWYVDLRYDLPRPADRVPSWSWAAVDGTVTNDSLDLKSHETGIKILDFPHQSEPSPNMWLHDKCSPGAALTIEGSISAATVRWMTRAPTFQKRYYAARSLYRHQRREFEASGALEEFLSPVSTISGVGPLCHELLHPQSQKRIGWILKDTNETLPEMVYCLKINVVPEDTKDPRSVWAIKGLVLLPKLMIGAEQAAASTSSTARDPQERSSLKHFRRVGYFELDCQFKDVSTHSEIIGHRDIGSGNWSTTVTDYNEYVVANKPVLDPGALFNDVQPDRFVLL